MTDDRDVRGDPADRVEPRRLRVGVLASGAGTNLQALLDTVHGHEVVVVGVAADRPDAPALERARALGIETGVFVLADYDDRSARDGAIAAWMLERDVELIVLAGYMAILTSAFLGRFEGAIVNVHPSLLPAFPGIHAIEQALAYGVKIFGVTVHFVEDDGGVDTGPVILQRGIELPHATDPDDVHERLRPIEHALVPEAVRLIARGAVTRDPANPRRMLIGE
ncbi:MAG: phosphoribosylglycinamide formyltransferase 1 [Solirubrobacteraceae bacterium]|jgi:phosphoribosylglycinamide formyltransferase-1|nr:phosphoribosylglycinamide formyltransferase 1 [Solirubrobacteraceae bacterium]